MKRQTLWLISVLSLSVPTTQAIAEEHDPGVVEIPTNDTADARLPIGLSGGFFWARGDLGERPGVEGNYFSLGGFAPFQPDGANYLLFGDGELWLDENYRLGGDIGVGYREWLSDHWGVGVNGFVMMDHSQYEEFYRRFSIGGELLSDFLSVTANGYFPFNNDINAIGAPIFSDLTYFQDHHLFFFGLLPIEQQLAGADIELGAPVPRVEWLSMYLGAYQFDSDIVDNFWGFSFRAVADLTSAVVDLTVQDDKQFGTTVNLGVEVRLGPGRLGFTPRQRTLQTQMFDRVRKRSRIGTTQAWQGVGEIAINPVTNQPFTFAHLDNRAGSGGNGSNERRYNDLSLASTSDADVILVHRGTTTRDNPLAAGNGLVLEDGQVIVGEGIAFQMQTVNRPDPIALPNWDQSGASPFISGAAGVDLITLADQNVIMGLNLISSGAGNMIAGDGITNFQIQDVNLDVTNGQTTGSGGGIVLTNATGTGGIQRFGYRADNVTEGAGGIVVTNTNAGESLTLNIRDISALNGGRFGVNLVAENSTINASLTNVYAEHNGTGLQIRALNNGNQNITVTGSRFNLAESGVGVSGNNIAIQGSTGGTIDLTAGVTQARQADGDNIRIVLDDATATFVWSGGSVVDAGDDAVEAIVNNGSALVLNLSDVFATSAGDDSLSLSVNGGSALQASFVHNEFSDAGGSGLELNVTGGSSATVGLQSVWFQDVAGDAVNVTADNATITMQLDNIFLDNSGGSALLLTATNGAHVGLTAQEIWGTNAAQDGMRFSSTNSQMAVTMTDLGSFAGAGDDAVDVHVNGGAHPNFLLSLTGPSGTPADFSGAGDDGLVFHFTNYSGFDAVTPTFQIDSLDFSEAGGNGLAIISNTSTFHGNVVDSLFSSAGENALFIDADANTPHSDLTIQDGDLSNAAVDAVHLEATNNTILNVDILSSDISGAGQDPTDQSADGTSTINLNVVP